MDRVIHRGFFHKARISAFSWLHLSAPGFFFLFLRNLNASRLSFSLSFSIFLTIQIRTNESGQTGEGGGGETRDRGLTCEGGERAWLHAVPEAGEFNKDVAVRDHSKSLMKFSNGRRVSFPQLVCFPRKRSQAVSSVVCFPGLPGFIKVY